MNIDIMPNKENNLEKIILPKYFDELKSKLTQKIEIKLSTAGGVYDENRNVFTADKAEVFLGTGETSFYNQEGVVDQFIAILSLFLSEKDINKLINEEIPKENIFKEKMLKGVSVLEYVPGMHANFAKAVSLAGADVTTVDLHPISNNNNLDIREIAGDFSNEETLNQINKKFDFITANSASPVGYLDPMNTSYFEDLSTEDVVIPFLKKGGYSLVLDSKFQLHKKV